MTMPKQKKHPTVLIVRDGWGANPHSDWDHANAVVQARTPVNDRLMAEYPHTQIVTHGRAVGLPDGIMGNSEVGHQNLGAGRIVLQEIMRITDSIEKGAFFENEALIAAFKRAADRDGDVHVMGLCSNGGVHSVLSHLYAILEMAKRMEFDGKRVYIHVIADGRDTSPFGGVDYVAEIEEQARRIGVGRVATVIGRYYPMDRDNRWDRVRLAYSLYTEGVGDRAASAEEAFRRYYDQPTDDSRKGDEFIMPTVVAPEGATPATIKDGDSVIFFNFRGDRPRELVKAFCFDTFPFADGDQELGFARPKKLDLCFVCMTAYESNLPVKVIMPKPVKMPNLFGQYVSDAGLTQFRCAETEKYPHVTFFFNGYSEEPFPGEDRQIIPSPRDVATYDQKPEMSAEQVADEVVARLESGRYDVVVVNFANGDMVGHTGKLDAAIKAVETVDACVGRVVEATLRAGGSLIVTADHGNCEQMIDPASKMPHTAHTTYDVEMIVVGEAFRGRSLRRGGCLADVAPTLLEMMGVPQPSEIIGQSLLLECHAVALPV